MFIDIAKIKVKAGNGGDGAVAFHREKYVAAGGPDGGDGGRGGNIVFQVDDNLSTLADFRYKRKYSAQNGDNGRGKRCSGRGGQDLIIRVPRGTLIKEVETGQIVADLSEDAPRVIAKGGNGGWGNSHFATPTRQTPRFAKPGKPGETLDLQMELKLLADVGLIGFPNVGKSTLVSVVSEAKPNIANYHFTTLTPVLGVVRMQEGKSFVMADIPGLIEGAGDGAGLGHQFLRHVERCRLLVHVVDVSGSEERDPMEDFEIINHELQKFNPELAGRPMIVAGNKCDLTTDDKVAEFKSAIESKGYQFFPIMAAIRHGVEPLLNQILEQLSKLPPIKTYEISYVDKSRSAEAKKTPVVVKIVEGVFYVTGGKLEQTARMVDFEDTESLQYFQQILIKVGAIDALREAGVVEGDTVNVCNLEFEFVD